MAMQLERPEQAEAELQALVSHRSVSADLCLEALSTVIQESRCSALKPAADILLGRFAEDATAPQHKVRGLLTASYMRLRLCYLRFSTSLLLDKP